MMKKMIKHIGIIAPFDASNIDTDIIIPKQFLQKITKIGFGKHLFHNWRFLDKLGKIKNKNFILNQKKYKNASILMTRKNFGCGSSREHAVWALLEYGFKVIIAISFSDIFFNNSLNNGLLLIKLSEIEINNLFHIINLDPSMVCTIDLIQQKIFLNNCIIKFSIDITQKKSIMYGLDMIDNTLKYEKEIKNFEILNKNISF
ncbi:3-isopropylmalate dehydratase small subunit (plasmid) [Buchnera aphidicola (Tuberolachnus salignus)]|uniref:3-isopropylmalate dehydratase small subunit n=1 Tax=Buchnera aphidicola subsp. Tuberolachnus salignus TaxID=98804 RepID=A0A160SX45_BUCTT|nr:3-isopropylmalate dehydratase small subunit [Buchnera aphidicola]CUR53370.1 3-isopropylmalate dehydratase small subunit [Buchnera aphidicola (Tuberolachnus salignus)]